jgi:adenosylhomocysteine nucleosidase
VPLTGHTHFRADHHLGNQLLTAAQWFLETGLEEAINETERAAFRLTHPRVHHGLIASGDQFMNDTERLNRLNDELPGLIAVEMEGAAVAQVCHELNVPFAVIRAISDNANENAATDFMRFVKSVAAQYAFHIVRRFCFQVGSGDDQPSKVSAGT